MPPHIVLLGDSVLDNRAYTRGEPDVASHLRAMAPPGWKVTIAASDGATTRDVERQMARVPRDASHVVLSVGGNDALMNRDLLATPVSSTSEALDLFGERARDFQASYRRSVERVLRLGVPLTLCTIYNGRLPPEEAQIAAVALTIFNDVIVRTALEHGLDVIELRRVVSEPGDYANPIEPSGQGGRKIADAILRAVSDGHRATRLIG